MLSCYLILLSCLMLHASYLMSNMFSEAAICEEFTIVLKVRSAQPTPKFWKVCHNCHWISLEYSLSHINASRSLCHLWMLVFLPIILVLTGIFCSPDRVVWTMYNLEWWVLPRTYFVFRDWPCLSIWQVSVVWRHMCQGRLCIKAAWGCSLFPLSIIYV